MIIAPWIVFTASLQASPSESVDRIVIDHPGIVIGHSCTVAVPEGTVLEDKTGEGVVRIKPAADGAAIVVEFEAGSELWGGPKPQASGPGPWDGYHGVGIRIDGAAKVTLKHASVHGFKIGVHASHADELVVDGGDFSDNFRQHLKSTPAAEDGSDWLYGHHNDHDEAITSYGAGLYITDSNHVIVHDVLMRRGQNGIAIRNVNDSAIYDNDCSFLSGWGVAMWRSSRNMISRNALDFCVRGHSEGVYNRGQDSAGVLCFEQCNDNVFAENSMTHGGDCFFGFAGLEAIGETWWGEEHARLKKELGEKGIAVEREKLASTLGAAWKDSAKHSDDEVVNHAIVVPAEVAKKLGGLGCNRNAFIGNDLSYAPAHGLEMTFSAGNMIVGNRLIGNGITGVWGGYDTGTRISGNTFADNGGMASGEGAGGVVMEHASDTTITGNAFANNANAVSMWWSQAFPLGKYPGVAPADKGVTGNVMVGNRIEITPDHVLGRLRDRGGKLVGLRLRDEDTGNGVSHVHDNVWGRNDVQIDANIGIETMLGAGVSILPEGKPAKWLKPDIKPLGNTRPFGARSELAGREAIVMDDWGPWDHVSPLVRAVPGPVVMYQVFGGKEIAANVVKGPVRADLLAAHQGEAGRIAVHADEPGLWPYTITIKVDGVERQFTGQVLDAAWQLKVFPCSKDPRLDLAVYHADAASDRAVPLLWPGPLELDLSRGPRGVPAWEKDKDRLPQASNYGITAVCPLVLPQGRYRITTLSDDGVRVTVGEPSSIPAPVLIDRWTHHAPTEDKAEFTRTRDGTIEIRVEYFQLDGFATLRLALERVGD